MSRAPLTPPLLTPPTWDVARIDAVLDVPWQALEYQRFLAQASERGADSYLFSDARMRFEPWAEDVLVAGAEPTSVCGMAATTSAGVDDAFAGLLQFPGGLLATIHSSFRATYRTWLDVTGPEGTLRINSFFKPGPREIIEVHREDEEVQRLPVEGSPLLFVKQIDDFVAAALDGRPPAVSLRESRGNTAVLAALHESAKTGRAVTI